VTGTSEIEVTSLDFYYSGNIHALKQINLTVQKKCGDRTDRPLGMRKDHAPEVFQPHA